MTEQELINLRNNLPNLNNTLIGMLERIESLESSALPKGRYFEQIIASFEDSPECCGCDGGDTGGGIGGGGDSGGGGNTGGGDSGGGGYDDPNWSDEKQEELEILLGKLVVEGSYLEADPSTFPEKYKSLTGNMRGHACNRARFAVVINGQIVGDVNTNNAGTGVYPADRGNSPPWGGRSGRDVYDIFEMPHEMVEFVAATNSFKLEFYLAARWYNPHVGVTCIRVSLQEGDGTNHELLVGNLYPNIVYELDLKNIHLGFQNKGDNSKFPPVLTNVFPFLGKYSTGDFVALKDNQDILINPDQNNEIIFKTDIVPRIVQDAAIVTYQLASPSNLYHIEGDKLVVNEDAEFTNESITIDVTIIIPSNSVVFNPIDTNNVFHKFPDAIFFRKININLTCTNLDVNASIVYKKNGVWASLDTGTVIPSRTLRFGDNITDIIINDKVTSIGDESFQYVSELKTLSLSENVTSLSNSFNSLQECDYLEIPDNITQIIGCFSRLGYYRDVSNSHIPESKGSYLKLPANVTILQSCFSDYRPLTPQSVIDLSPYPLTNIGGSFNSIESPGGFDIILPNTLVNVGGAAIGTNEKLGAFEVCNIRSVRLGKQCEYLAPRAFLGSRGIHIQVEKEDGTYYPTLPIPIITILQNYQVIFMDTQYDYCFSNMLYSEYRKLYVPHNMLNAYRSSEQWTSIVHPNQMFGIDPDVYD